jgi:hypothetical protein
MSKPVYLYFCILGFTEAWYQLSKEEQDALWAKDEENTRLVGAKRLIMCNSRWADEATLAWGVEEYPDMDAYQKKVEEFEKLNWNRYLSAKTILGTKMEE